MTRTTRRAASSGVCGTRVRSRRPDRARRVGGAAHRNACIVERRRGRFGQAGGFRARSVVGTDSAIPTATSIVSAARVRARARTVGRDRRRGRAGSAAWRRHDAFVRRSQRDECRRMKGAIRSRRSRERSVSRFRAQGLDERSRDGAIDVAVLRLARRGASGSHTCGGVRRTSSPARRLTSATPERTAWPVWRSPPRASPAQDRCVEICGSSKRPASRSR